MSFPPILTRQQQQQQQAGRSQPPPDARPQQRQEALSSSWPSATLRRQLAQRTHAATAAGKMPVPAAFGGSPRAPAPRPLQQPRPLWRSCESMVPAGRRASPPQPRAQEEGSRPAAPEEPLLRFSLRLTPEAALVLQRRNLEKQLSGRRPGGPTAAAPGCPRRAFACSRRGSPLEGRGGGPKPPPQELLLKISLLNDQNRYDDVEYEEEDGWGAGRVPDEGLVRRCTEWLRGVESAVAPDRLHSLPHLSITQ
ncbi:proline-rich protein 18 [Lissotriton helveticus]